MTDHSSTYTTYLLLKFISLQPTQISRFIARMLAGLFNFLKMSKTSDTIRLNLQIALPELTAAKHEEIIPKAIHNELTSYFEFFSIWGADNHKNIARIHSINGEQILQE